MSGASEVADRRPSIAIPILPPGHAADRHAGHLQDLRRSGRKAPGLLGEGTVLVEGVSKCDLTRRRQVRPKTGAGAAQSWDPVACDRRRRRRRRHVRHLLRALFNITSPKVRGG